MEKKLIAFLNSPLRNAWIGTREITVYLRKSRRVGPDGQFLCYLDSASVAVKPRYRQKGKYRDFVALCQRLLPAEYAGIFHENVHEPVLRDYYRRLALEDKRWIERELDFFWERSMERAAGLEPA